jgi:putative ABC transport system ATP-binding protein
MTVNEIDVGRNVEETLRVVRALKFGELCPAGWQPGQDNTQTYNEWLAKVFPRLSETALANASEGLQTVRYDSGDIIVRQGDRSDRFYIIVDGEVAVVYLKDDGKEAELATLGPGEMFGEMGILMETRRTADVRANTDVSLLALDWNGFKDLIDSSEQTAKDFMRIVEQRRARAQAVS